MPSTIGKCKFVRIKHTTLLEGETFLRNKHKIAFFFKIKCTFLVEFAVLKNNIREAFGEIQLHSIDNVLKNWTDRVGYCMASRGRNLNKFIFHY